jgi:hypothetical protein
MPSRSQISLRTNRSRNSAITTSEARHAWTTLASGPQPGRINRGARKQIRRINPTVPTSPSVPMTTLCGSRKAGRHDVRISTLEARTRSGV